MQKSGKPDNADNKSLRNKLFISENICVHNSSN